MIYYYALGAAALLAAVGLWLATHLRRRHVLIWLPSYVRGDWAGRRERSERERSDCVHVMFCVADHFEPAWARPPLDVERRRVQHWVEQYPASFSHYRDSDGRPPRHTFFYPEEEYRPEHLDSLAELVGEGYAEVEVHLHHDGDTASGLRSTLRRFLTRLNRHGLLTFTDHGEPAFAFVHGNWALDNSRPDGRWCGINNELQVLAESGCYADFTLPSAPSPTQTRRINSIYYATDDPNRPKSHDDGVEVRVAGSGEGDLMIIQGPLAPAWRSGRFPLLPRIENADLCARGEPSGRLQTWLNTAACVAGRPDWLFVKLHAHGCQELHWAQIFGRPLQALHETMATMAQDGHYKFHYVTAREMYNIIKAAESGASGNPGDYRDFCIAPPPAACATDQTCRKEMAT